MFDQQPTWSLAVGHFVGRLVVVNDDCQQSKRANSIDEHIGRLMPDCIFLALSSSLIISLPEAGFTSASPTNSMIWLTITTADTVMVTIQTVK